ncbi:M23 family metallopeptidase [Vallitalea maricola]|uniref:M23 family metallopeptidase n=1 Tax=Vallitalea maricola TaxID=3074433 RepID=A0ACB5UIB2_9FIRM|nr:M23 family metallopeptidase [Vallitalea sp. AN17-2]
MKKRFILILTIVLLSCVMCVYVIGGMPGVYAWNLLVFIFAPIASLSLLPQIVVYVVRFLKKKDTRWNLRYLLFSIAFSIPITVLFGVGILTYPTKANEADTVSMLMPVENPVLFGGREYITHSAWPSECYAYDILSEPYDIDSSDLTDYGIFGKNVIAPISGLVIGVEDTEPDIPPNTEDFTSSFGNYIFMEIEESKTYLILAHLEVNSVKVSVGDYVQAGQIIAKVGNSGTTSEPHLHIQHQRNNPLNTAIPTLSEGLPIDFKE